MASRRREWVWGVDPHVSHVSFGFAALDSPQVDIESLRVQHDARDGERLGLLDRQVRIYCDQVRKIYEPTAIWVEQPSGQWMNLPLFYAVGVIQAALYESFACPVWTFAPTVWKKRSVGVGNASKRQVAAWVHARDREIRDEHECDAYAMACAGRAMVLDRSWEAAA